MINKEKVALMTKLAAYEDGEGKKNIPHSKYFREDYVSLKMINTGILVTLAYILVLAIIVFVNVEKMMTQIANMDFVKLGKIVITYYVIIFVSYMLISYIVYSVKFKRVRKSLNGYNGNLKKLYALYKEEEKRGEVRK